MTPDQLTALAQRLRDAFRDHVTGERLSPGVYAYVSIEDVEAAADYLRQCAQAKPVAWLHREPKSGDQWLGYDEAEGRACPDCRPVYIHPQPQQVGVPSGWQLVPVEPKLAQWEAGAAHVIRLETGDHESDQDARYTAIGCAIAVYKNMLAAAPQPPSAQADAVEALRQLVGVWDSDSWSPDLRELHAAQNYARAVLAAQEGKNGR